VGWTRDVSICPSYGGTLTISAIPDNEYTSRNAKLKKGDYLRLSVSDTGIGMDENTASRAIEPFFSTKGIGKGAGLALSMVHGLAAQLGGVLSLKSKPGSGTCVELWLPVSSERAEAGLTSPLATADGTGPRRVLLVDDEELVRLSTAAMLADLAYEVFEASSGEEALQMLQQAAPDLLLTESHARNERSRAC
jgi:CheY-like chemotaxis protein